MPDGTYRRKKVGKNEEPFRVQVHLYQEARKSLERARAAARVTLEPMPAPEKENKTA
jgi:hypothetical protein